MTPPLVTPLILPSDIVDRVASSGNAANLAALLDKIIEESDRLQRWCNRFFDEQIDTRYYTARSVSYGGDLLSPYELWLDNDLRAVTALNYLIDPYDNTSGTTIASGYAPIPTNRTGGVLSYNSIRLNPYGTVFFYSQRDPENSIGVAGKWGYGGQWLSTGATVTSGLAIDPTVTSFVSSATLEPGMMLRIDSEYIYVNTIGGTSNLTNTVDRAANGSTAATHTNAAPIYRWEADPIVRRSMVRLVLISLGQDSSPLFSSLMLLDTAVPVQNDGNPKDVLYDVAKSGLKRPARIMAV